MKIYEYKKEGKTVQLLLQKQHNISLLFFPPPYSPCRVVVLLVYSNNNTHSQCVLLGLEETDQYRIKET